MKELLNNITTMSSKEIADLTGKTHANVLVDIRAQILSGLYGIPEEKMIEISIISGTVTSCRTSC